MIRIRLDSVTSNADTAIRPVGPHAKVNAAMIVPIAAGVNRFCSMERSNDTQAVNVPDAMIGSGHKPLL